MSLHRSKSLGLRMEFIGPHLLWLLMFGWLCLYQLEVSVAEVSFHKDSFDVVYARYRE